MEEAIEMVQAKDAKERMGGVERLQQILEHSRKSLTASEVSSLVDASLVLLKDNNFRVSQGALQALASAAALSGEHLKLHFNALIPAIVERLGDGKQPVRDAARRLLLALMEVSSPTIIVERAGSYAWTHKNWRVREEFARTVASAISLFAASELPFQRLLLPYVLQLLEDSNNNAREAAMACFEEMYHQGGPQFRDELQRHHLRPSQLKDINARLEKIEPKMRSFDGMTAQIALTEVKSSASLPLACNKRSSPKAKAAVREASLSGVAGDNDVTEKPVDPIKVYSEKELMREIDKIAGMLAPEQDWSVRIAAMQRVEGLVFGGAPDYACFPTLIKQLVGPLSVQLSDRRSSIVKQACHLLSLLSKELLGDFESCAESFIPVLFKLVVITVLVIAESADNCIKTMLRNCKVARILPRIVDCAKHDRSAVLRARCCEYALLVLEYWADAPEIQRSADLYEDLIKCCVGDAMSEVRSMARTCYRMFAKTWPDRSRRLFVNFDPVIQRLINEEEGGIHKRYSSPSIRDRGQQQLRNPIGLAANTPPASIPAPGYGTSAIVAMDRSASLSSVSSLASTGNLLMSQRRAHEQVPERSLESVLQASKQQVSAIESMLRGLDASEKGSGSMAARPLSKDPSNEVGGSYRRIQSSVFAARTGVDPPSARDPPFPAAAPATNQITARTSASTSLTSSNIFKGGMRSGVLTADLSDVAPSQVSVSTEVGKAHEASSALTISYSAKRVPLNFERLNQRSSFDENNDMKAPRRVLKLESQMDKLLLDTPYKDTSHKDSQYSSIPNFQRPLLRKYGTGRSSGSNRISIEDNQLPIGEIYNYMDGLMSLNDALTEGLSSSADWSARVAAFNYLRKLLQQGPRGIQDVTQSFEKVMKLFFQHLDDPHHKVAQAALSTLAELVPACRKPFEGYLERILPHVFSRLVDPKELIRQLCSSTLEIVGNTYSIESVLPALLRSLDEQRSPKAKVAVIEFAIASFTKLAMNGEASGGSGLLKLWLAKLAPLANDKNTKLKETAVTGIISVYSHFDSTSVLNFILGLSIEEQSTLRRALKQYTPRIEVDLMNFLQSKNQRSRSKSLYDQSDVIGTSSEEGYVGSSTRKTQFFGRYSSGSIDSDNGRKWSSVQEPLQFGSRTSAQPNSEELQKHFYQNYESSLNPEEVHDYSKSKDSRNSMDVTADKLVAWSGHTLPPNLDARLDYENSMGTPRLDSLGLANMDPREGVMESHFDGEADPDAEAGHEKADHLQSKHHPAQESGPSIPSLLHQMCDGNDEKSVKKKREALQVLVQVSKTNEASIWSKYFNQILTGVLEVLDDPDSTVRELSLAVIVEMLSNQKDTLEDSVEILLEKLLHATKDLVAKVSSEADRCATIVLSQYDPYRCLTVVVPLLVSEDEKTLVTCISCLTKLVGRLPPEELMAQLPSFLPALFDAFGNQSADVRKTVVFCLVDIYIVLGKAFLPYLGSLSSTQLRLVTIYANRISQARSGATLDSNQA